MLSKHIKILIAAILFFLAAAGVALYFFMFKKASNEPVVLWTNRVEFVSYAEYFNASQNNYKVSVIYKESPAESLPPAKDEIAPDIVIGPWLKNERSRKYFIPLDYLFTDLQISSSSFYPQLLTLGNINDKQYLLPISFNLPLIIFSKNNQNLIPDSYVLSLDQIRDTAASFNSQNESGIYTSMGFSPRWEENFLYLAAKLQGANFKENGNSFSWDNDALDSTVLYLRNWTKDKNTSTTAEEDFKFKYLYTPEDKQITSGKCLFSFITSDELFSHSSEQIQSIDYRWIHENYQIPIDDQIISLGIYKKSRNTDAAEAFIIWFMKEDTQKQLLERTKTMELQTTTFGISGGFSAVRSVNEHIFPSFYPSLLGNLPSSDYLITPNILPSRWEAIKERVIVPYLSDAIDTTRNSVETSLESRIAEWNKQYF